MTQSDHPASQIRAEIGHCVAKIRQIIAERGDDRRSLLQLGYNLGRLSELTGEGRGPFWDAWKDAVAAWDGPALEALARNLQSIADGRRPDAGESPVAPECAPP